MERDSETWQTPSGDRSNAIPPRVRLVYKTLLDGRFHIYTSPDVLGLHASSETMAGAQRQAIAILDGLAASDGVALPVVSFLDEWGEAASWRDLQAAQAGTLARVWDNDEDAVWDDVWRSAAFRPASC